MHALVSKEPLFPTPNTARCVLLISPSSKISDEDEAVNPDELERLVPSRELKSLLFFEVVVGNKLKLGCKG